MSPSNPANADSCFSIRFSCSFVKFLCFFMKQEKGSPNVPTATRSAISETRVSRTSNPHFASCVSAYRKRRDAYRTCAENARWNQGSRFSFVTEDCGSSGKGSYVFRGAAYSGKVSFPPSPALSRSAATPAHSGSALPIAPSSPFTGRSSLLRYSTTNLDCVCVCSTMSTVPFASIGSPYLESAVSFPANLAPAKTKSWSFVGTSVFSSSSVCSAPNVMSQSHSTSTSCPVLATSTNMILM
mmetsp:Transcript_12410/g.46319  ORF Transcript_12410/g.46319 Transcript_12410/m.46319 type:complete len:241 (+) Transcript_12410:1129-1851(+)